MKNIITHSILACLLMLMGTATAQAQTAKQKDANHIRKMMVEATNDPSYQRYFKSEANVYGISAENEGSVIYVYATLPPETDLGRMPSTTAGRLADSILAKYLEILLGDPTNPRHRAEWKCLANAGIFIDFKMYDIKRHEYRKVTDFSRYK